METERKASFVLSQWGPASEHETWHSRSRPLCVCVLLPRTHSSLPWHHLRAAQKLWHERAVKPESHGQNCAGQPSEMAPVCTCPEPQCSCAAGITRGMCQEDLGESQNDSGHVGGGRRDRASSSWEINDVEVTDTTLDLKKKINVFLQ